MFKYECRILTKIIYSIVFHLFHSYIHWFLIHCLTSVPENKTPEPSKVNDPNIEIKENEIVTSTKDNNSPVIEQKKINIDSDDDDDDDSPEIKYLPITVKITPHRSEDQVDKGTRQIFSK